MRRNLIKLFAVGAFCLSFYGYGQQKPITGRVVDSEGIPVQDAYIYIEGSNEGVYADENGNYTIQAAPGDVIKIEFIGLDSQSIVVGDKSKYNVKLKKGDGAVGLD
ncbi:carboxypeptidase-like regulatory domain-containing protein, partial [Ornithobacterium rhinotracheale]